MKNEHVSKRPAITQNHDGQLPKTRKGAREASPRTSPNESARPTATTAGDGGPRGDVRERIVVAQFSVVHIEQEDRLKLDALRNTMHRMLNAAIAEWHRAEKRPSANDPSKEVLDRSQVTEAVKTVLDNERRYWTEQLPKLEVAAQNLRTRLELAQRKGRGAESLQKDLLATERQLERARCRSVLEVPSAIYDSVVYFTQGKYNEYKKDAFRGARSNPTFREGNPVRWRDKSWSIQRTDKSAYEITVPVSREGTRVQRAVVRVVPDGPSMYNWAKRMTDEDELAAGTAKQCDMRLVYSEAKKQWFAKVTARFRYETKKTGDKTAAMRRGLKNAFAIAFEDGSCRMITGSDVIAFKAKIKARRESVARHLRSLELGSGARGHGKKRRFAALNRIDDAEARFVDTRCKTWASAIVRLLRAQGVGRLVVATPSDAEFLDKIDSEVLRAHLRQFPFHKAFDALKRACEYAGISVEEKDVGINARRCPKCLHVHNRRQIDVFVCDVCKDFKRPADQIVAWNMLVDFVGDAPVKKSEEKKQRVKREIMEAISD